MSKELYVKLEDIDKIRSQIITFAHMQTKVLPGHTINDIPLYDILKVFDINREALPTVEVDVQDFKVGDLVYFIHNNLIDKDFLKLAHVNFIGGGIKLYKTREQAEQAAIEAMKEVGSE